MDEGLVVLAYIFHDRRKFFVPYVSWTRSNHTDVDETRVFPEPSESPFLGTPLLNNTFLLTARISAGSRTYTYLGFRVPPNSLNHSVPPSPPQET